MKVKKYLVHMIIIMTIALSFLPMNVHAAEGGIEVGNGAGVEFYYEDSSTVQSSSAVEEVTKPVGKLPQTGEIVKKSMMLSGVVLLIGVVIFYLIKRRKTAKGDSQ